MSHSAEEETLRTKNVDSKGRLLLGARFAKQMVIVDDSDPDRIVITPAVAVPKKEAWFYQEEQTSNADGDRHR